MVYLAQAAHWFDWSKLWPEVARVLRKGGSAAFWASVHFNNNSIINANFILLQIYSEFRIQNHQSLTPLITQYSQPQDADPRLSLGPHWQRPGRTILENHLLDVPDANQVFPEQFSDWERIFFVGTPTLKLPRLFSLSFPLWLTILIQVNITLLSPQAPLVPLFFAKR